MRYKKILELLDQEFKRYTEVFGGLQESYIAVSKDFTTQVEKVNFKTYSYITFTKAISQINSSKAIIKFPNLINLNYVGKAIWGCTNGTDEYGLFLGSMTTAFVNEVITLAATVGGVAYRTAVTSLIIDPNRYYDLELIWDPTVSYYVVYINGVRQRMVLGGTGGHVPLITSQTSIKVGSNPAGTQRLEGDIRTLEFRDSSNNLVFDFMSEFNTGVKTGITTKVLDTYTTNTDLSFQEIQYPGKLSNKSDVLVLA